MSVFLVAFDRSASIIQTRRSSNRHVLIRLACNRWKFSENAGRDRGTIKGQRRRMRKPDSAIEGSDVVELAVSRGDCSCCI